jgi:hypothetical protein
MIKYSIHLLVLLMLNLLTSCAAMMPEIFKSVEDIATDTALKIEVDKEALQRDTDIKISVDVINKELKQ